MKIPYFVDLGKDAPKGDVATKKRRIVAVIVEHPFEDKIILLDWKNLGWKSFIIGGIEEGETIEEAGIRETIEETGYNDIENLKVLPYEVHNSFYASHKGENRYSIDRYVHVKLKSLNNIGVDEDEVQFHDYIWVDKKEVEKILNIDNNKYAWRLFTTGKDLDLEYLQTLKCFNGFK